MARPRQTLPVFLLCGWLCSAAAQVLQRGHLCPGQVCTHLRPPAGLPLNVREVHGVGVHAGWDSGVDPQPPGAWPQSRRSGRLHSVQPAQCSVCGRICIQPVWRLRQEDPTFEDSPGKVVTPCRKSEKELGCSSVVDNLPGGCKALYSIPSAVKEETTTPCMFSDSRKFSPLSSRNREKSEISQT